MKKILILLVLCLICGCSANEPTEPEGYWQPSELSGTDLTDESSRWCWKRSKHSEHFILFWEEGFGSDPLASEYPVDTDDLLEKAEQYWHTNVDTLKMTDMQNSQLQQYKMQIYLLYTEDWVATGSGYDNVIGALWVSPSACSPVGSVIAHEVGHCFQYQVYCDHLLSGMPDDSSHGFRYGYENSNGGNGLWEQCAQWASFMDYPEEAVTCWEFDLWPAQAHRAFEHEYTRYQSYWLPIYWTEKHGADTVSRIWRESRWDEDALAAYLRLFCGGDTELLNDELYDYAAHTATFDYDMISDPPQNVYHTEFYDAGGGWQQVAYSCCPGEGGFNVTELPLGDVSVEFQGLAPGSPLCDADPGIFHLSEDVYGGYVEGGTVRTYNDSPVEIGWRCGIVALMQDGTRRYGPCHSQEHDILTYEATGDESHIYLVVVGTSKQHVPNPWDDDERTDIQMPYKILIF